jgi:hypothetical protein
MSEQPTTATFNHDVLLARLGGWMMPGVAAPMICAGHGFVVVESAVDDRLDWPLSDRG